jgi:hypothetical protein
MFNVASIYFQKHLYEQALTILDALFVHIENYDIGLSAKISYLLLETIMCIWNNVISEHTEGMKSLLEIRASQVIQSIEKLCYTVEFAQDYTERSDEIFSETSLKKDTVNCRRVSKLQSYIAFKIDCYRCRINIMLCKIKRCKKDVRKALETFQRDLRPGILSNADMQLKHIFSNEFAFRVATSLINDFSGFIPQLGRQHRLALQLKVIVIFIPVLNILYKFYHRQILNILKETLRNH